MTVWWRIALGVLAGAVWLWVLLVVALIRAQRGQPNPSTLADVLRLVPDVVRMLRRVAADRSVPRGVRWRVWFVLLYLISPIDLVPDFIPLIGYADDAVVLIVVLRSLIRRAGPQVLERHWPGTPEGLAALVRLADSSSSRVSITPTMPQPGRIRHRSHRRK